MVYICICIIWIVTTDSVVAAPCLLSGLYLIDSVSTIDNVVPGVSNGNTIKAANLAHIVCQVIPSCLPSRAGVTGCAVTRSDVSKIDLPILNQEGNCAAYAAHQY